MLHNNIGTLLLDFFVNLVGHFSCLCILLGRVGKTAESLKLHISGKLCKLIELLLGFTRKTCNKG